jgi:RHS repeat-associated protein
MQLAQAAKEKMHAPVFSLAASAAAAATTKSAGTNPIPQPVAATRFFKTNPKSRLARNSRLGHQLPTAILYQGIGPAIPNTATSFAHPLYDSRVRPRCTGKERDAATGLDFFGARYFSGPQGRFTSPDPIVVTPLRLEDLQLLNAYVYARNNPFKFLDPDGRDIYLANDTGEGRKKALTTMTKNLLNARTKQPPLDARLRRYAPAHQPQPRALST